MAEEARFTILSMMKDEGPWLLEWVAFHRHIGFDNICVYTNDCTDGTDAMLARLEALGEVRHFRNDVPEGRKPQPHALSLAQENPAVTDTDWLLVIDADEFLSIKAGRGWVPHLVRAVPEGTDAVAVTWRFFGSNGITAWNPGLVTESFTRAAPDAFPKGWGVKTLFRPFPHMKLGIHRPTIHGARKDPERAEALLRQAWVNGSGRPMPEDFPLSGWRSTKPTLGYKLAEMNHYAVKSREAYLLRRLRGNVNLKPDKYNANYFALFDRNELEAPTALRHLGAVRTRMAALLADPELARLQEHACAVHEARLARMRETEAYRSSLADLERAAAVPFERLDEILFTQHLPKKVQEKVEELRAAGVPDRVIARMVGRTRTAKKGDDRAALRAKAEGARPGSAAPAADRRTADAPPARPPSAPAPGPEECPDPGPSPEVPRASHLRTLGDPPRIHLVSTLKNEGPYLVEWLAHHRALGVTDVTLFSNDCTDGTNLMLDRLQSLGVLSHFDNPIGPRMDPQRRAYSRAGKMRAVRDADYVLIVDADEFVTVRTGDGTLPALLRAADHPDALSLGWRLMGSGGAARWVDAPVTGRFTRGANLAAPENGMVRGFKTLFRPRLFDFFGVHRPKFEKDRERLPALRWVDGSAAPLGEEILRKGWRFPDGAAGYGLGWVAHYAVKSREEFLLKRLRGTANSKNRNRIDLDYWTTFDLNSVADTCAAREETADEIDRLMADPDLAALRRACLATARRALDAQLADPELRAFVEHGADNAAAAE